MIVSFNYYIHFIRSAGFDCILLKINVLKKILDGRLLEIDGIINRFFLSCWSKQRTKKYIYISSVLRVIISQDFNYGLPDIYTVVDLFLVKM